MIIACTLTDVSGQTTEGSADLKELASPERTLRASKRAGIFTAIAVVCILIPMLHFVLVPAFLIVAGVAFVRTMAETSVVTKAEGVCPHCKQTAVFTGLIKTTGTKEICPNCRQLLRLGFRLD